MNKTTCNTVKLGKGEVNVYDFGTIRLHAYKTNDFMSDEVFILEKNGKSVILESPCFFDNESELTDYLKDKNVYAMLIAYHDAGGNFLPDVKKYATLNAKDYGENGGGKALIDGFTKAFGEAFDKKLHVITDILPDGKNNIAGIDFVINVNDEAYTVEIPEINAVYTHMLGHDCHSIVAGSDHADAIISELEGYINKGFTFILTSHYTPENLKDAEAKIAYLKDLKAIASVANSSEEFKKIVNEKYPDYSGANYLEMTAGMFYKK